uniref:Uncharacterized protein n=1 Tax=Strongyloides venezuelensis TaxID=75913 RepID=A0A0K0F4Z5_STRVS
MTSSGNQIIPQRDTVAYTVYFESETSNITVTFDKIDKAYHLIVLLQVQVGFENIICGFIHILLQDNGFKRNKISEGIKKRETPVDAKVVSDQSPITRDLCPE